MLKDSQKQKAEIVWTLKLVLSGYSNNICADISKIFTCMFPDSKIAKPLNLEPPNLKILSILELLLILGIYCIIICKNLIALLFLLPKV